MRERRCQRLQKVLHWQIISVMLLPQQLLLPTEYFSFSHLSGQASVTDPIIFPFEDSRQPAFLQESLEFLEYDLTALSNYNANGRILSGTECM